MADEFRPGATVRLKSGGPVMTVVKYGDYEDGRKCSCKWFDDNQTLQTATFADHELEVIEVPSVSDILD